MFKTPAGKTEQDQVMIEINEGSIVYTFKYCNWNCMNIVSEWTAQNFTRNGKIQKMINQVDQGDDYTQQKKLLEKKEK